jgi:GNAT superfamily N-acetyltransferase
MKARGGSLSWDEERAHLKGGENHAMVPQMRPNEDSAMTAVPPSSAHLRPADPVGYPHDLEREVTGDGNLRYRVRPIRPEDAGQLVAFHRHLSPHSVYLRFFSFHPELSEAEVYRFTTVDYQDRLALVALDDDRLIGVGRFDRKPGEAEAEVAFVVADEYQHHGVGTLLLDELARAARQRGIETFRADTLAENRPMLDVFHHAGFPVTSRVEYGTVTLRFPIAPTEGYSRALDSREARRQACTPPS